MYLWGNALLCVCHPASYLSLCTECSLFPYQHPLALHGQCLHLFCPLLNKHSLVVHGWYLCYRNNGLTSNECLFFLLIGKCPGLMEKKQSDIYFMFIAYLKSRHSSLQQSDYTYQLCIFSHSPKTMYTLIDSSQPSSISAIPYLQLITSLIVYWANRNSWYFLMFPVSYLPTDLHFYSFWPPLSYNGLMWHSS